MPFLPLNQQRQSTEGNMKLLLLHDKFNIAVTPQELHISYIVFFRKHDFCIFIKINLLLQKGDNVKRIREEVWFLFVLLLLLTN